MDKTTERHNIKSSREKHDKEITDIFDEYQQSITKITGKKQSEPRDKETQPGMVNDIPAVNISAPSAVKEYRPREIPETRPVTDRLMANANLPAKTKPDETTPKSEVPNGIVKLEKTISYTDFTRRMNKKRLGDLLVENKIISPAQLQTALDQQNRDGGKIGEILVKQGLIKHETLLGFLSQQLDVPIVSLKDRIINPDVLALVPEHVARERNIIPVEMIGDRLAIVMGYPEDVITIDDVTLVTGKKISIALGSPADIENAIDFNYDSNRRVDFPTVEDEMVDLKGTEDEAQEDIDFSPAAQNLNKMINQAVHDGASDIHIEPYKKRLRIRFRIDGVLKDKYSLPVTANDVILNRIKILGKMNIAEHRRAQDGQFAVKAGNKSIDIRVATIGTAHGERATLRILDKSLDLISLDRLGFLPGVLTQIKQMLGTTFGMILVGGPTGSGKTTTLYSMINHLDRHELNIVTIEDPIEYGFTDITQMQVNEKAGIDFSSCLKATMRHDPDVILIGEIRDPETAKIATQAALTGHLVLASIHANDVSSMVFRLIHLGVEPYLISSTLIGLMAQRLVRSVCSHCAESAVPSADEAKAYRDIMKEDLQSVKVGRGCGHCSNTGCHGRTGIHELLSMNDTLRSILINGGSSSEIRQEAINQGMITMSQAGMTKVKMGLCSIKDVLRSIYSPG
jgi:type II secretory ATPase GspE/PulE/Tfp pilus assembly ATPase PilB-like protein